MKKIKRLLVLWLLIFAALCSVNAVHASSSASVKGQAVHLTLYRKSGSILRKYTIRSGQKKLPGMKNPDGYTFLGWSTRKGQRNNPKYYAGQIISIKKDMKLYPVFFNRANETDPEPWELPGVNRRKYSKVIFVGDSRTYKMRDTFRRQCGGDFMDYLDFVCKSGQGIRWFQEEGYALLKNKIQAEGPASKRKPIAIVFNLGVNDLRYVNGRGPDCDALAKLYGSYFNRIGRTLASKNCRLFYMSVNPLNSCMLKGHAALRREEDVRYFNLALQNALNSRFTYLDTHTRLAKYGYSTKNDVYDNETDDGLHYSMATYKRIYRLVMDKIARV